jgi:integrase
MAKPQRGVQVAHKRSCASREGGDCNCHPSYKAEIWIAHESRKIRRSFPTLAAARAWRHDALSALRKGTRAGGSPTTIREAAIALMAGIRSGAIRTRSGDEYKPSARRNYDEALKRRVLPLMGHMLIVEVTRGDVQRFVDRLLATGISPSTIRNTVNPLRVIYRQAMLYGEVAVNPTIGVQLPAVRGKRDRVAAPEEAARLLELVPERDRAIWATAMYAGLRRGEMLALMWSDIDFERSLIHVERGWDMQEGIIYPKSRAGLRTVPLVRTLRAHLLAHQLLTGRREGFVFGRTGERPFNEHAISNRAKKAWAAAGVREITLHECRHTYASLMIAARVNPKALSTYMGHSSITITLDRYGHLFPGNESEAADLLDAYLEREERRGGLGGGAAS